MTEKISHSNQEEHRIYKTLILNGCSDKEAWAIIHESKKELREEQMYHEEWPKVNVGTYYSRDVMEEMIKTLNENSVALRDRMIWDGTETGRL